ncbi:MAG: division/cell wall cluster transcriptional repressor MraZ [Eggerthellaceae bacterium]|uniref:Transcriptional regulator MraZ n=1 Tax=Denitrobacterium detoxificans TaxID=79604 RepID=A0A172RYU6_9ACTN|nr:mraZ protein [Denitrobacterium detoxificans]ANE22907.1 mraZ protein [Denitrobacterium detoxificans]MCR5582835.1 division/cell wall cluster transcriptional repressor MraZ [Eggerthellaceae bacterium]SEO71307.1 MraZ protein [Denitrobacterium detoxificans]
MTELVGEHHHKLDAKGRVSMPSDFRKVLPKNLKVTLSPKKECLYVFEPQAFSAWVASFFESEGGYKATSSRHVNLRRALNARARDVEVDGSGRIGLSADLREAVGLEKEVVLTGNDDHLEIWDAKRWDEFMDSIDFSDLFSD